MAGPPLAAALTALYRTRLAAVRDGALVRLTALWRAAYEPGDPLPSLAVIGQAAETVIGGAQAAAVAETAAWLEALARAAGAPGPFALPALAGTSAAGRPLAEMTGLAPAVYQARLNGGLDGPLAAQASAGWLGRLAASEPHRAANEATLAAAAGDRRLTGRVMRHTSATACQFCQLIAGRGYLPAHAGFAAHAHCGCTAGPEITMG